MSPSQDDGDPDASGGPPAEPEQGDYRAWLDASDAPRHSTRELEFDSHLAVRWRWPSEVHWTPIAVCRKAALLLCLQPGERVLDVGSGVGKFCIVGASVSPGEFVGVEWRQHLVEQSRRAAAGLCVRRVAFHHGDAFGFDWTTFNALYLYNPFEELQFPEECCIDDTIAENGVEAFSDRVQETVHRLELMPVGTRVATYHGFGADFPEGYEHTFSGCIGSGNLDVWKRVRR